MIDINNILDDGGFDNEYEEKDIVGEICLTSIYILVGIILYPMYLVLYPWKKTDAIVPFSIGNYAHSQYMHWAEEAKYQDCQLYNRWNTP